MVEQDLESPVSTLLDHDAGVVAYIVESDQDQSRMDKEIRNCTLDAFSSLFHAVKSRHGNKLGDNAMYSSGYMYRRIWLAHQMARTAAPNAKIEIRGRVDHHWEHTLDWNQVLTIISRGHLAIGADKLLYQKRKDGVPHAYRCVVDDQLAIGSRKGMGSYSSVFPDLHDLLRFMQISRQDSFNHQNERILTTHLHYRGVGFEDFPLPLATRVHGD